jgi:hypothetical protein
MTVLVNLLVILGMLVVLPIGLRLLDYPLWTVRAWRAAALPAAVALWLPRGLPAAALAVPYALATVALAGTALAGTALAGHALTRIGWTARRIAVLTALVAPSVAGSALVAERAGDHLLGFRLDTLALTVAHFHYAGFTAALVAALVCAATGDSRPARAAALGVPLGTGLVFVGFFTGDEVQLAGAAVLTAGMWLAGWVTWREIRPMAPDTATRVLLGVSAVVLAGTMLLALDWALGEAVGVPHLPLFWMAATHGLANALGFALCAVLAWRRLRVRPW